MGLEPSVQLDVAGRSKNFLADTEASYSVLTSYSGSFASENCTILGATGKTVTKKFTEALLHCWDGQIFSHQFLVVPECPTPLLEKDLSLPIAVLIEDASQLSLGANYFYQPPSETMPKWEKPFMDV